MGYIETKYEIKPAGNFPVVSAPYVDTPAGRLDTVLNGSATELAKKVDKTYVDSELAKKANKTYVDSELAKKANTSAVSALQTAVNSKADSSTVSALQATVNTKADSSTVSALSGRVSSAETGITEANARIDQIIALPEGSTTEDARLEDICVMIDGQTAPSPGDAVRKQVTDLKSDLSVSNANIYSIINNDLFISTTFINGYINDENNYIQTTSYKVSDYIKVKSGDVLKTGRIRFLCFYNTYKTFSKSDSRSYPSSSEMEQTYTVPEDGYVKISVYASDYDDSSMYCLVNSESRSFFTEKSIKEIATVHDDESKYLSTVINTDLLLSTTFINGYVNTQGSYTASDDYKVSDYIEVKSGQVLKLGRARFLTAYDIYKGASPSRSRSYDSASETEHEYIVTENGYVKITIYTADYNNKATYCLLDSENRNVFTERAVVDIKRVSNAVSSPILTGKKLVFCGDSFTEYTAIKGGSSAKTADNYDFDMGVYKTYPWWIAKRNNFTLVNEAKSGSTITKTGSRNDAFSDTRYKNIPADADYIIIKFGINDVNESATLGTINDTTNTTFYGAWNTVMSYLRTTYPKTKIGIIITNGLGTHTDYAEAEIAIAKKWGVGYLNEAIGTDIPVFYRTSRTDVSSVVTNKLLERFAINQSGGDTHPTVEWHEYESTIVENWLRSL